MTGWVEWSIFGSIVFAFVFLIALSIVMIVKNDMLKQKLVIQEERYQSLLAVSKSYRKATRVCIAQHHDPEVPIGRHAADGETP